MCAVWLEEGELTNPERRLYTAAAAGHVLDLRTGQGSDDDPVGGRRWGTQRTIRAVLLRQLLLREELSATQPIAVRVRAARSWGH